MNEVDLDEVERWSEHEGMLEEFHRIRGRLASGGVIRKKSKGEVRRKR